MNRIAIVESQEIVREGLKMILSKEPGLLSFCVSDPISLFRQNWTTPPNLVIMDKIMPGMNGVEAIQEIKKRWDTTKILIFTSKNGEQNVVRAFQAGANGYILNTASPDELVFAVMHILSGYYYVSPLILPLVIEGFCQMEKTSIDTVSGVKLSTRERELLKLIAEGNKNREIAHLLCLSVKTVETHRYNLMKKLDIHNIADLTVFASRAGVI